MKTIKNIKKIVIISLVFILLIILVSFFTIKYFPAKSSRFFKLPNPNFKSSITLEQAIKERRSVRDYANTPLNINKVAQLLWAGQGITTDQELRTAPSAGALYPIELYLVAGNIKNFDPGIYKYQNLTHQLEKIISGDKRVELYKASLSQEYIRNAPAIIIICANYGKTTIKYDNRGKMYVDIEIGAIAENIYLQAVGLNMGTVFIGSFDDVKVKEILKIGQSEIPVGMMPIGNK